MTQELTYTEQAYIKLEHLCITKGKRRQIQIVRSVLP